MNKSSYGEVDFKSRYNKLIFRFTTKLLFITIVFPLYNEIYKKMVINRCIQVVLNNNMLIKHEHAIDKTKFKDRIFRFSVSPLNREYMFFRKLAILFRKNLVVSNNVLGIRKILLIIFNSKYVSNT